MIDPPPVSHLPDAAAIAPPKAAGRTGPLRIAFCGTGVMGGPMAGHLVAAGHHVTVFNRTRARADAWATRQAGSLAKGGSARVAASPAEAAAGADAVITCVGNDDDVTQVLMGPGGAMAAMPRGGIIIDHSTVSATLARQLFVEGEARGLLAVDAPVSGGQAGAENASLSIMCGGTEEAVEAARPLLAAYGARIVRIGAAGAGQTAKMVNQIAIAGGVQGLAEAVRFTQGAGLDPQAVFEAISGGAAASWQMTNRWATMHEGRFDFGFAVDWMRKDLGLALDEARGAGVALPVAALVDQFYAELQAQGHARSDTSALVARLPRP